MRIDSGASIKRLVDRFASKVLGRAGVAFADDHDRSPLRTILVEALTFGSERASEAPVAFDYFAARSVRRRAESEPAK